MNNDDTPKRNTETCISTMDGAETTFLRLHLGRVLLRYTRLCIFLLALITALSYLARWNRFAELLTHFAAVYFTCAILAS